MGRSFRSSRLSPCHNYLKLNLSYPLKFWYLCYYIVENVSHGTWLSNSKVPWSCSLPLLVLLQFVSCLRCQIGDQPPANAFVPSEMLLPSQSYTGQILQPTYSPNTLSHLSYTDGFDEEPPLLEGKNKTKDDACTCAFVC